MNLLLQEQIRALAQGNQRSTRLLAVFTDGFAVGWAMAVKACFRSQLDIKYTARVEKQPTTAATTAKRQVRIWTQGPRIAFDAGHVFYDTPLAYDRWGLALQRIKRACMVLEATPNEIRKRKPGDGQGPASELIDGRVLIELFSPDRNRTRMISQHRCELSQNAFVEFLMTGNLPVC